jgi:hypothetical protein
VYNLIYYIEYTVVDHLVLVNNRLVSSHRADNSDSNR